MGPDGRGAGVADGVAGADGIGEVHEVVELVVGSPVERGYLGVVGKVVGRRVAAEDEGDDAAGDVLVDTGGDSSPVRSRRCVVTGWVEAAPGGSSAKLKLSLGTAVALFLTFHCWRAVWFLARQWPLWLAASLTVLAFRLYDGLGVYGLSSIGAGIVGGPRRVGAAASPVVPGVRVLAAAGLGCAVCSSTRPAGVS